jgi:hypothetical protein
MKGNKGCWRTSNYWGKTYKRYAPNRKKTIPPTYKEKMKADCIDDRVN